MEQAIEYDLEILLNWKFEYNKKRILYLEKNDVAFEVKYDQLRIDLNQKYNLELTKKTPEKEMITIALEYALNPKRKYDFSKLVKYIQIISYFKNQKMYSSHWKKRILHIYSKVKNNEADIVYKDLFLYDKEEIEIYEIRSITDFLNFKDKFSTNFYRGHSSLKWELLPSIYRNKNIKNESKYYKELLLRYPDEFKDHTSALETLSKMQHYSCPTRLLDITTNPLVGLFFACKEMKESVGELVVFKVDDEEVKYTDSDIISIVSNLSKISDNFDIRTIKDLEIDKFNGEIIISKLLHEIRQEKPYFYPIIDPDHLENVYFVKPIMRNKRIIKQDGCFIIFGINGTKKCPAKIKNLLMNNKKRIRAIIPNDIAKRNIMNELDLLGINQGSLFPEIENYSEYLKEKFKT